MFPAAPWRRCRPCLRCNDTPSLPRNNCLPPGHNTLTTKTSVTQLGEHSAVTVQCGLASLGMQHRLRVQPPWPATRDCRTAATAQRPAAARSSRRWGSSTIPRLHSGASRPAQRLPPRAATAGLPSRADRASQNCDGGVAAAAAAAAAHALGLSGQLSGQCRLPTAWAAPLRPSFAAC